MPSNAETLDKVKGCLPGVTSRKMMGEYLLYKDGILFGGIYDDRLLLKITKASAVRLKGCPPAFPYEGGGEMILFPEPYDVPLLIEVVDAMCEELSAGGRKRRSRSAGAHFSLLPSEYAFPTALPRP
jgi:TfoX/Sxy family transcriptional regulator of competence genes